MINLQKEMGWKLLLNEHFILKRDSSEIVVAGAKCFLGWPFPRYGNLDTAYVDYDKSNRFVMLLQHSPDEWKLDRAYQKRVTMLRLCGYRCLDTNSHRQALLMIFGVGYIPKETTSFTLT